MPGVSTDQVAAVLNPLLICSGVFAGYGWIASLDWSAKAKSDGDAARAPRDATDAAAAKLAAALTAALAGAGAAWLAPTSPLASGLSMVRHIAMLDADACADARGAARQLLVALVVHEFIAPLGFAALRLPGLCALIAVRAWRCDCNRCCCCCRRAR